MPHGQLCRDAIVVENFSVALTVTLANSFYFLGHHMTLRVIAFILQSLRVPNVAPFATYVHVYRVVGLIP